MNYLDLFSGIGGFALGLTQAGFKFDNHYFSEVDKYAIQIYRKQFPGAIPVGDVCKFTGEGITADLITFGFPCQDLSIAGKRRGIAGGRSGLFYEATRLIRRLRPRCFIFENVKGLFSSNKGEDFVSVLREVTDIGYDGQWQLLNTKWFLPQNRERIYFIGHSRGECRPEVFPIGENDQMDNRKRNGLQIASALRQTDYKGTHNMIVHNLQPRSPDRPSLKYSSGGSGRLSKEDGSTYPLDTGNCQAVEVRRAPLKFMQRNQKNIEGDYAFTIDSANTGGVEIKKLYDENANHYGGGVFDKEGLAPTLTGYGGGGCTNNTPKVENDSRIRRLTPTECERLQGFPDGWTEGVSDTQRYKQLGNAVSVPVVKAIGEKLL